MNKLLESNRQGRVKSYSRSYGDDFQRRILDSNDCATGDFERAIGIKLSLCSLVLFSSVLHALPVQPSDTGATRNHEHAPFCNLEYLYCQARSDIPLESSLKISSLPSGDISADDERCQIISEKRSYSSPFDQVLVQTRGSLKWGDLLDCVTRAYQGKFSFIPLSATPNADVSIRTSLTSPVNLLVTNYVVHNPLDFIPCYINRNESNSLQQQCFKNDEREECQVQTVSTLPVLHIWLQKAPLKTVVHEEVFEAASILETGLNEMVNQYLARLQANKTFSFGVYLTFMIAPDNLYGFVSGVKPGLIIREYYRDVLAVDMITEPVLYIHYEDKSFENSKKHLRFSIPKEWSTWYNRLSVVADYIPVTGNRYTCSLEEFFFYESLPENTNLRFIRIKLTESQLRQVSGNLHLSVFKQESKCLTEQLRVIRVTAAQSDMHVLEVVYEESGNARQDICAASQLADKLNLD